MSDIQANDRYSMYFDGCSKGNPGKGGAGAVIYDGATELTAICNYAGEHVTNNFTVYVGLMVGLSIGLLLTHQYISTKTLCKLFFP